jgi:hypothetical protein
MGCEHVHKRLERNLKLQKMSDVLVRKNNHMARVRWREKEKEVKTSCWPVIAFFNNRWLSFFIFWDHTGYQYQYQKN